MEGWVKVVLKSQKNDKRIYLRLIKNIFAPRVNFFNL